jgi:hypothetical protein
VTTPSSAWQDDLLKLIGPTSTGIYLRPFVSDGDPTTCPIAIVGYNAATPIPASEIPAVEFARLLQNREEFERFYRCFRVRKKQSQGKQKPRPISTTRKRLGLIRQEFSETRVVETNLNAWPTKDVAALKKLPPDQFRQGKDVADWALRLLQPKVVIAYGDEISLPGNFSAVDMRTTAPPQELHPYIKIYPKATWKGGDIVLFSVSIHMAARGPGVTDSLFRDIGKTIDKHVAAKNARDLPQHDTGPAHGNYERIRRSYKPDKTRVLFVGESRPGGGTFFFNGDSNLVRHTQKSFEAAFKRSYESPAAFLTAFKAAGFWLVDLCVEPVNGLNGKLRREACKAGEPALARLLAELRPRAVIGVKLDLEPHIRRGIASAGIEPPGLHMLPFPLYHHAARYQSELARILENLCKRG